MAEGASIPGRRVKSDENFPVRIESTLGIDLLADSISGEERMGRLFVFHLELLSENPELMFDDVVGQRVTVVMELEDGERYFNGFITEFRYSGARGQFSRYQATVRPWFWFLTRTSDCRIFQDMTVPDIIKQVFGDNGMADFEPRLNNSYRRWEYCVQYRESDFNFISRLMEQEGIYYFFEHEKEKHKLVMIDDVTRHAAYPNFATIPYHAQTDNTGFELTDVLDVWTATQYVMPSRYAMQDYNFKSPDVNLLAKHKDDAGHETPLSDPEIYDYPGEYIETAEGMKYVEIRQQELACQRERINASGTSRGLAPGYTFTLSDHPRDDQNKEYLAIAVEHMINNKGFFTEDKGTQELYRCQVEVMDKTKMFRSARETPKPVVQGPQTAVVVGPSGEEIHTDEYGRVKVQFHWDRYGEKNQSSSCWMRVSQIWAGKRWGAINIPRIGQEVIVSFLEGDPDQPIITGRVYNAAQMPPYTLPDNKTQSGIKSRSTKEGSSDNFNEIRMEDKIGEEELYIQAEKNENILVKNNKGETVGNNETISIGNDREESVGNDETIAVGNDRKESVGRDEDLSVSNNRKRNVGVDETINVGGKRTHTVGNAETITVGEDQNINVGKNQSVAIGTNRTIQVGKDQSVSIGAGETRNIGNKLVIKAGDSITLECGASKIIMKKNGDIKLDGKNLVLNGNGSISVKASGQVKIKGATIAKN
jgi:type VI secretion system secreted protein VgrG